MDEEALIGRGGRQIDARPVEDQFGRKKLEFRQEGRRRGEEIGNENSMYVWYIHGTKFRFSKGRWRKKNDQYNIIFGRSVGLSRGPRCRFGYPAISHMEFSVRETGSFLIDSLTNASLRTGF